MKEEMEQATQAKMNLDESWLASRGIGNVNTQPTKKLDKLLVILFDLVC